MKKVIIIICVITVFAAVGFGYVWIQGQPDANMVYAQEYESGTGNIKGDVDIKTWESRGEAFAIGANADGYAVFKNPQKAMKSICQEYKEGIKAMRKAGAPRWFQLNYDGYMGFAEAIPSGTEARQQADVVEGFVDIYENSFSPK